ncbi:MAG: hypothetical protein ACRENL_07010 [Candidatus Dormibacteria bacterium]
MDEALKRRLAAIVGARGIGAGGLVTPVNITQLGEVLAACAAGSASVAPSASPGAGRADVVVGAVRLGSILLDATAMLLHAGAAATWTEVREAAAAQRLAVSGLPTVRSDTVGDSVALGEIAHRTLAGVDLLTQAGALISAGGRTLKDVVGYDLAGLFLGSGDRLGLIVAATLRLEPAAARTPAQPGLGPWRGDAGIDVAAAFAS